MNSKMAVTRIRKETCSLLRHYQAGKASLGHTQCYTGMFHLILFANALKLKKNVISRYQRHVMRNIGALSDYRPDNRTIEVRFPAEAVNFASSLCVQTGSEAHPASYPMGTGGSFPGGKRGRGVTLTVYPL
jgi:hypothetical protein